MDHNNNNIHHQMEAGKKQQQEAELRKGPWLEEEDEALMAAISVLGERRWESLAKASRLRRSGKSCRLRWMNYLRPNLKHGHITQQEEAIIIELHKQWGNRWSKIARNLPGRTDNEIKNYWRCHLKKKASLSQQQVVHASSSSSSDTGESMFDTKDGNLSTCVPDFSGDQLDHHHELSSNIVGLIADSPYENRLLDWSSSSSPYQTQMETLAFEYCCYYDYGTSLWEWDTATFSIWNMEDWPKYI